MLHLCLKKLVQQHLSPLVCPALSPVHSPQRERSKHKSIVFDLIDRQLVKLPVDYGYAQHKLFIYYIETACLTEFTEALEQNVHKLILFDL